MVNPWLEHFQVRAFYFCTSFNLVAEDLFSQLKLAENIPKLYQKVTESSEPVTDLSVKTANGEWNKVKSRKLLSYT